MSDKYSISEIFLDNPNRPSAIHVETLLYIFPAIKFGTRSKITMEKAQAICDLLNNWKEDE